MWLLPVLGHPMVARAAPDGLYLEGRKAATPYSTKRVFSVDNRNQRFRLSLITAKTGNPGHGLRAKLIYRGVEHHGSGALAADHSWFVFDVDTKTARRFARKAGLKLRKRSNLEKRVVYQFTTAKRVFRRFAEVPITLRVWRRGKTAVDMVIGGRTRGPRNDRFRFDVSRAGKKLATKPSTNFGGRSFAKPVGSKQRPIVITAKLSRWVDLRVPGTYHVRCTYEGELVQPKQFFASSYQGDRFWTFKATSALTIEVK